MNLPKRLVRQLSFANVIACIALFVALGGGAYAATKINGNSIQNASIGGGKLKKATVGAGKLKNGTITSQQIAAGTLTGTDINVTTLGTVPSAQTAAKATNATNANHATTANTATNANHATTANSATTATSATNATSADTAKKATEADRAKTAGDADTLDGLTPGDFAVSCRSGTEFYGGVCWDEAERPFKLWIAASKECGDEGGRLPNLSELIAYVTREGLQVNGQNWSSDVSEAKVSDVEVMTSDETTQKATLGKSGGLGFRCVFYQEN
jgi:hypothetical protein